MDKTEALILSSVAAAWLLLAFALFGVVVVRRRDPSPHLLMLACLGLAAGSTSVPILASPGSSDSWWVLYAVTCMFTTLLLILSTMAWALAVWVRPGEPTEPTSRAWLHTGIVAAGTVATGLYAGSGLFATWWFPSAMHIVLSYRDSTRVRRAWGAMASIALVTTLGWLCAAWLNGAVRYEAGLFGPALVAHHVLALSQARTARLDLAVWPVLALGGMLMIRGL